MICASRVHIFNLCAKRQKKSALTYRCKKTRLQTISTFIDYEEERKKESERNLQNKMQNLKLQLH